MDLERLMAERMRAAFDRQMDAAFYGTTQTVAQPAPVLTWERVERAMDEATTDRRIIIARDLRPFRKVPGWALERETSGTGYWFRATEGPRWRIKVYLSGLVTPPRGTVYVVDPDAKASPVRVAVGGILTTVTALALAGVDEAVG